MHHLAGSWKDAKSGICRSSLTVSIRNPGSLLRWSYQVFLGIEVNEILSYCIILFHQDYAMSNSHFRTRTNFYYIRKNNDGMT
jgi:hypothetical protein